MKQRAKQPNKKKTQKQLEGDFAEIIVDHVIARWKANKISFRLPAVSVNNVTHAIKQGSVRVLVLLLALGMNGIALVGAPHTNAFYTDTETSSGNLFFAALLDFELSGTPWVLPDDAVDLDPGDTVSREVTVVDTSSIDFKYVARSVQTGGDTAFCEALMLEAFLEGVSVYSGPLLDFLSATSTFSVTADDWRFDVTLPLSETGFGEGESCSFDFIYNGWQERFENLFEGYHDQEGTENGLIGYLDECVVIDFETDALGAPVSAGQVIDDEYGLWGITVSAINDKSGHPDLAITFDSENPTGGDYDLGTPHTDFGGPGIGNGGKSGAPGENSEPLGNVLIIAENDLDANNDGLIDTPDDEARGGLIDLVFAEPTYVEGFTLIDIDGNETNAKVELHGTGGLLGTHLAGALGNNSVEDRLVDTNNVTRMKVFFEHSGAIDNICVAPVIQDSNAFVVLNEVLADPDTQDSAPENREFIELYNNGLKPINVEGWMISELFEGTEVFYPIVATNATSGEMQSYSGTTIIESKGSIVLQFSPTVSGLDNDGDTIRLYDTGTTLRDTYTYTTSLVGKSDARIPDGFGEWIDPEPTPGAPNVISKSPALESVATERIIESIFGYTDHILALSAEDTEAPTITLFGNNPARIPLGSTYADPGGLVSDNVSQNLGMKIYDEDVYTDEVGVYEVMYVAFDQAGNMGSAVREVEVYEPVVEAGENTSSGSAGTSAEDASFETEALEAEEGVVEEVSGNDTDNDTNSEETTIEEESEGTVDPADTTKETTEEKTDTEASQGEAAEAKEVIETEMLDDTELTEEGESSDEAIEEEIPTEEEQTGNTDSDSEDISSEEEMTGVSEEVSEEQVDESKEEEPHADETEAVTDEEATEESLSGSFEEETEKQDVTTDEAVEEETTSEPAAHTENEPAEETHDGAVETEIVVEEEIVVPDDASVDTQEEETENNGVPAKEENAEEVEVVTKNEEETDLSSEETQPNEE